jgi:hypothetical protein
VIACVFVITRTHTHTPHTHTPADPEFNRNALVALPASESEPGNESGPSTALDENWPAAIALLSVHTRITKRHVTTIPSLSPFAPLSQKNMLFATVMLGVGSLLALHARDRAPMPYPVTHTHIGTRTESKPSSHATRCCRALSHDQAMS